VSSEGAITAALVADTGAASGYVLRFTVASGTLTDKSATLTRFVPVASSASRSFSFYAEATFENGTNSTQSNAQISFDFYQADQVTATGSTFSSDLYAFNVLQTPNGITAPNLYGLTPGIANVTAPADAAFLKLTITIATVATQSDDRTVDLTEVRLAHGLPELLLTDKTSPASRAPAYITNDDGLLTIIEGTGDSQFYLDAATTTETGAGVQTIGNFAIDAETLSANIQDNILLSSGADITVQATLSVDITAPDGVFVTTDGSTEGTINVQNVQSAGDLRLLASGSDVYVQDTNAANGTNPRILFRDKDGTFYAGVKSGAANVIQILNGSSATDYAQLWAERIYPMDGSTASRYIFDNGTQTAFSGAVLTGTLTSTGVVRGTNFTGTTITTATTTANNAVWVLTAGTTYNLRRFTSSQRYKTNIVDADEVVLEAAKKIRPRHFTSTLEDENGATRLGFIAEEVEEAGLTHAIGYDEEGRVETLDSMALIAALYARVNDLEERLKALESR
jgi:hypothetical protein